MPVRNDSIPQRQSEHPLQREDYLPPRALTQREHKVLMLLVSRPFAGSTELQKQVSVTSVDYGYVDEATISLCVDRTSAPPAKVKERVPISAIGIDGDWVRCAILLFVDDGYLSMM